MEASKTVVLLSGGLDSAVLLHQVHETGGVLPLFIDYGQRAVAFERAAAEAQCRAVGAELVALDVSGASERIYAGSGIKPHSPLPLRNLVIASLALSYAEWVRASAIALAVIRDDLGAYACTTASFWFALRDLAAAMSGTRVETPFIYLDKASVVAEGERLGVDLSLTYSCTVGLERHCGTCSQCHHRRRSMSRAGFAEPADFYMSLPPAEPPAPARAPFESVSGSWRW